MMKAKRTLIEQTAFLMIIVLTQLPLKAQSEQSNAANDTSLGVRQRRVSRMMEDLERRLTSLARSLEKTEPEQADRLSNAFGQAKQLLIQKRMSDIVVMLNRSNLDSAGEQQKEIITDLRQLIAILLDENSDRDKLREEIERLQKWRSMVQDLINQEKPQQQESEEIADKDENVAKLTNQIDVLRQLIDQQQQVQKNTSDTRKQGIQGLGKVADQQKQVREKTERFTEQIKDGADDQQKRPGQDPLEKATKKQQQSQNQLEKGKGKVAEGEQQQAVDEMKKALKELQQKRDKLSNVDAQNFENMADRQNATADKTGSLGQQMAQTSSESGQQQPGQQQVGKAQQAMKNASSNLQKQKAPEASQLQSEAVEELTKAMQELDESLAKMKNEMQSDRLAELEAFFREMLARQQKVTRDTVSVDKRRQGSEKRLRRSDRLAVRKLSQEEKELAAVADKALALLVEDGTSIVFPRIVTQLHDDLLDVGKLLTDQKTDVYTQTRQKEIELSLEELIEALQKAQQQMEENAGDSKPGESGEGGDKPLLPDSAELKLLRAIQLRVNRRTKIFDQARPQNGLNDQLKNEILDVAELQKDVASLAEEIAEKVQ